MAMGDSVMETPDGAADATMDVDTALLPRAFPLLLFHMIKTEQSQNGVKHSDYARYRHARFATSIGMGGDGEFHFFDGEDTEVVAQTRHTPLCTLHHVQAPLRQQGQVVVQGAQLPAWPHQVPEAQDRASHHHGPKVGEMVGIG